MRGGLLGVELAAEDAAARRNGGEVACIVRDARHVVLIDVGPEGIGVGKVDIRPLGEPSSEGHGARAR
mgnify:FL=1